jgi:soluble lytic murein transglycosylase-like protein
MINNSAVVLRAGARFLAVLALMSAAPLAIAYSQEGSTALSFDAASVAMLKDAMRERIGIGRNRQGVMVPAYHCRHAKEGCDRRLGEFAQYLVDAGQTYGIDPYLIAAMGVKESGLNPFAKGAAGELGILQIHPGRRDARQVRFIRDEWYRKRCAREPGACQREIVDHAAKVLARSLELCGGSIPAALGAYNTGHCGGNKKYAKRVLLEREELRKVAGIDDEQRAALNLEHANQS